MRDMATVFLLEIKIYRTLAVAYIRTHVCMHGLDSSVFLRTFRSLLLHYTDTCTYMSTQQTYIHIILLFINSVYLIALFSFLPTYSTRTGTSYCCINLPHISNSSLGCGAANAGSAAGAALHSETLIRPFQ